MRTLRSIAALATLSLSLPVFATPTTSTYDFNSNTTTSGAITTEGDTASYNGFYNGGYFGNAATFSGSNGGSVSVTAWASTGMVVNGNAAASALAPTGNGSGVNNVGQTSTNGTIQNAVVTAYTTANGGTGPYSGNGYALAETSRNTGTNSGNNYEFTCPTGNSCTTNAPNHAIDNQGAYETLLFNFSTAVTLSNVTLGYPDVDSGGTNNDGSSDMTILYCIAANVANCASSTFAGQTFSQLVSSGNWAYTDLLNLSASNDTGSTGLNVKSQYWMVGAYIADLPGQTNNDGQPDYIKIRDLTVCTSTVCAVPEPGSVALFGIAGCALWVGRRRRQLRVA